jgi:hypothetical protein
MMHACLSVLESIENEFIARNSCEVWSTDAYTRMATRRPTIAGVLYQAATTGRSRTTPTGADSAQLHALRLAIMHCHLQEVDSVFMLQVIGHKKYQE